MKKALGMFLLLASLSLLVGRAGSAESWKELLDQADSLSDAGKYNSAIVVGQKALEKAKKELGDEDTVVALVLDRMGLYHVYQANYGSSESLWKRALAIREKALGSDHPDVAKSLDHLAFLSYVLGRYAEAEPLQKRALAIKEKALGSDHPDVAKSLDILALLYGTQGKDQEAELLLKRALAIREKALGPDHPDVARSLDNLALLYCLAQGKYAEAEPLFKRALVIREKALGPDHPDHPYVAESLENLANLYLAQGRYAEVEHLLRRALAIWEKALGPDHPYVAGSLTNLANLYFEQGKYAQAQPLFKRALAIREKALGPDHPDVAESLGNLAFVYLPQGRYAEAEHLLRRALAICEKALGPDHPNVAESLTDLAVLYFDQGKYAEAEPLYKRALSISEKALGSEHLYVAPLGRWLAICCMVQGKCAEAEPLYKQALDNLEKGLGRDHPNVAWILEPFSYNFRLRGNAKKSLETAKRAFEIRKKNFRDGSSVMSEKDALTYSLFMRTSASNYLSVFLDWGLDEDTLVRSAVDVIVSSKGQVSDEIFARNKSIISEPDTNLLPLVDSLCYTRFRISKLYVEGPDEDSHKSYWPLLDSLSKEKERLESELAWRSASFRQNQELWEVDAQKILNALPKKSVLVEYLKYNYHQIQPDSLLPRGYLPRYLVVAAFPPDSVFITDLGEVLEIDSLIDQYRRHLLNVSASDRLPSIVDQIDYEKIAKSLYDKIWKPIEEQIPMHDILFIAPDGGLNMVSFAGLMGEDGKYLIEKYPIHYLSSGRDLIRLKDEAEPGSGLFALGDPDYNATAFARLSIPEGAPEDSLPEVDYYATRNVRSGCGELKDMTVSALPWTSCPGPDQKLRR